MMNNFKLTAKVKMIALMLAIGFVTYNIVLFVICGFTDHGASFWISYIFMLLAFVSLTGTGYMLKSRDIQPKDWLLGYPVLKHATIYIVVEFILSVLFMALDSIDSPWWLAFTLQMIVLAIHAVFIISCLLAQDTIIDVQTKVKDATSFIKLLQVDVEMVAEKATDATVKKAFDKLAEQVRYIDPRTNENLFELEKQITLQVGDADRCLTLNDIDGALQCCNKASLLLVERNKKCKALK